MEKICQIFVLFKKKKKKIQYILLIVQKRIMLLLGLVWIELILLKLKTENTITK